MNEFSPLERDGARILSFVRTADINGYNVKMAKVSARFYDGMAVMCLPVDPLRKNVMFCGVRLIRLPAPEEMFRVARLVMSYPERTPRYE